MQRVEEAAAMHDPRWSPTEYLPAAAVRYSRTSWQKCKQESLGADEPSSGHGNERPRRASRKGTTATSGEQRTWISHARDVESLLEAVRVSACA